jgi:enoyl-CoA hydratase/carnithine racemase
MSELLALDRDERGVYTLTIRRPDVRNALNAQTRSAQTPPRGPC